MANLENLLPFARRALETRIAGLRLSVPAITAIDATAGNGRDSLFLARHIGPSGKVWAFDIQEAAIRKTRIRLEAAGLADRVTLVCAGHQHIASVLAAGATDTVHIAMFNLGFLPGGNRAVTTQPETTIAALQALLPLMAPESLCAVHCYAGHAGGDAECARVRAFFSALPWKTWHVAGYAFVNKDNNPELLLLAERLPEKTTDSLLSSCQKSQDSV